MVFILARVSLSVWEFAADGCFCRLRAIAWNPLGTLVATGSADKTLRVCTFHLFFFFWGGNLVDLVGREP